MATKWIRSTDVIWEELDGQALLVHSKTGARWSLNTGALAVWKCCDGSSTLGSLATNFGQSKREIAEFCRTLAEVGLLSSGEASLAGMSGTASRSSSSPFGLRSLGLTAGPRRRPSPRGNSGPG